LRALDRIRLALHMVVDAPVKPGTIHRLVRDPEYEVRLAELVVVSRHVAGAFERGRLLAEGRLDARGLGLGQLFASAARDVFEFTEERPLAGLVFAALASSAVAGYASVTGRDPLEEFRRLSRVVAYATGGGDSLSLVEALEAVGYSEAVLALEEAGLSKRSIGLEDTPLGEVTEKLLAVDTGFAFNLRGAQLLDPVWRSVRGSSSLVELVLRSFYGLGVARGVIPEAPRGGSISSHLASLERKLERGSTSNLLGGTAWIAVLENYSRGLPPVPGLPRG